MTGGTDSFRNPLRYQGQDYRYAPFYLRPRAPTTTDLKPKEQQGYYPIGSFWINQATTFIYYLAEINSVAQVTTAHWVLLGTALSSGIQAVNVDAGASPVEPDGALGRITITGAQVAAGTIGANVIRTDSLAVNAFTIQIQRSSAVAASDSTKNGVAHFNSADFSVDANGFVTSLTSGVFNWIDQGSGITLATNTGYFVTAATTQTLPAAPAQGNVVKIICDTAGAVIVTANAGQFIREGNQITVAGTFTSTKQGDALELVYRSASSTWYAQDVIGNWTIA